MKSEPLILEIKRNSLDDGPGIRTVIFFKGCPLNCLWCHNPESKKAYEELSWDKDECIACYRCVNICPNKAIDPENPFFIDRAICKKCFSCVLECPSGAMSKVGQKMSIDEIVNISIKDKPFYNTSNGGVTLSGGEPLMNIDFTSEILRQLKRYNIHTLIETCGYFNWNDFEKKILPFVDMVYFDIKIMDAEDHKKYCGVPNNKILSNLIKLIKLSNEENFNLLPRVPLVPDITACYENLKKIAFFLKDNNFNKVSLLRYNPLWHQKYNKLGLSKEGINQKLTKWMSNEDYENCKSVFNENQIEIL